MQRILACAPPAQDTYIKLPGLAHALAVLHAPAVGQDEIAPRQISGLASAPGSRLTGSAVCAAAPACCAKPSSLATILAVTCTIVLYLRGEQFTVVERKRLDAVVITGDIVQCGKRLHPEVELSGSVVRYGHGQVFNLVCQCI